MTIQLRYPLTLSDNGNHKSALSFTAFAKNKNQTSRNITRSAAFNADNSNVVLDTYGYINLPMPTIGEVTYTQRWDTEGEGLLTQLGQIFNENGGFTGDTVVKSIGKLVEGLGSDTREAAQGSIANQRETAKFRGTDLRTQTFSYQFRPRNINELAEVSRIITMFKIMAASDITDFDIGSFSNDRREAYNNGSSTTEGIIYAAQKTVSRTFKNIANSDRLKYPAIWTIKEIDQQKRNRYFPLFKFGPAVITSISVNMTPHDYWMSFENGDPASIDFSVSFTETSIVLGRDIAGGF